MSHSLAVGLETIQVGTLRRIPQYGVEGNQATGGSTSIRDRWLPLRNAVATARIDVQRPDMLIAAISEGAEIDVHLIASAEKLGGVGETGTPRAAAALCNAVYAASDKRIRTLPVMPALREHASS